MYRMLCNISRTYTQKYMYITQIQPQIKPSPIIRSVSLSMERRGNVAYVHLAVSMYSQSCRFTYESVLLWGLKTRHRSRTPRRVQDPPHTFCPGRVLPSNGAATSICTSEDEVAVGSGRGGHDWPWYQDVASISSSRALTSFLLSSWEIPSSNGRPK